MRTADAWLRTRKRSLFRRSCLFRAPTRSCIIAPQHAFLRAARHPSQGTHIYCRVFFTILLVRRIAVAIAKARDFILAQFAEAGPGHLAGGGSASGYTRDEFRRAQPLPCRSLSPNAACSGL